MSARRAICDHCADVIGVYEPIVVVLGGEVRETSRAAAPMSCSEADERYHRACYESRLRVGSWRRAGEPD